MQKYPRTPHLPNSPGFTPDDLHSNFDFKSEEVVVSIKLDGECTTLYNNHLHARSVDSKHHPSRNWIKNFHSTIKHDIPEGYRICGENLFAFHSIFYTNLPSYFLVFNIWNKNTCLSWDETVEWCQILGLHTVPVIYCGTYTNRIHQIWENVIHDGKIVGAPHDIATFEDEKQTVACGHEGYVIRTTREFHYDDFNKYVAKWVRKSHVKTDNHWMFSEVIPNLLKET